jgi:hypothetical protein
LLTIPPINTDNHLSPQIIDHNKGHDISALKIQILARDGYKNGKGVNWVIGIDPPPLYFGSPTTTQI